MHLQVLAMGTRWREVGVHSHTPSPDSVGPSQLWSASATPSLVIKSCRCLATSPVQKRAVTGAHEDGFSSVKRAGRPSPAFWGAGEAGEGLVCLPGWENLPARTGTKALSGPSVPNRPGEAPLHHGANCQYAHVHQ